MLSVIRRATWAGPTANYVCLFCQRHPLTVSKNLTLGRLLATKTKPVRKPEASAELIKEIRTEIEAHREGLKKKKKGKSEQNSKAKEGEKKKKAKNDFPKAPRVRRPRTAKTIGMPIEHTGQTLSEALKMERTVLTVNSSTVELKPITVPNQPQVPALSHDLDRVLFNPGVYFLQDPRSRVYNFDPYLQKIMPVNEFHFEALSEYITSSRDTKLETVAKELGKKYVGSTSSMTSVLSHFHYLLSNWRPINPSVVSQNFSTPWKTFTALQRGPQAIFLRWKDGVYAVDADKEFDKESVLTLLGKSMEKLLTLPPESFEKYRRSDNPLDLEVEAQQRAVDTYHYSTLGDFLMRSQLDAHDPRLPGTGMFDLKTRAVVSVRMDVDNFHIGSGYQIKDRFGEWESFEREYFDMIRAAFLKYSLQVRMGRMDGIFVAFHNTERIFGFQYITLEEMDASIHQDWHSGIGDREFKLSLQLLNDIFNRATQKFPGKSLRMHFETRETQTPLMYIFAEPMEEQDIDSIQNARTTNLSEFLSKLGDRKEQYLRSLSEQEAKLEAKLEADEKFTEADDGVGEGVAEGSVSRKSETGDTVANGGGEVAQEAVRSLEDEEPDDDWAEMMAKTLEPPAEKELLAFTLKVKSFVNGKIVLRPDHLKPSDSWEVQYELEEIKGSRAWSTYRACYTRRLQSKRDTDDLTGESIVPINGGGKTNEFRDVYIQTLRDISKRGREYITELEKETKNAEKIVWKGRT